MGKVDGGRDAGLAIENDPFPVDDLGQMESTPSEFDFVDFGSHQPKIHKPPLSRPGGFSGRLDKYEAVASLEVFRLGRPAVGQ